MKLKIIKSTIAILIFTILALGAYSMLQSYSAEPQIKIILDMILEYKVYSSKGIEIKVGSILLSIFLIAISFKVSQLLSEKVVPAILKRFNVSEGALATIKTLSFYFFLGIFVIAAFSASKIPLTVFTLFGGALAIGIGFGSQSLVSNFISGIIIQVERPLKVGDIVVLETAKGKVTEIGARSTKILTADNTHVIVPNSHFLDRQFTNLTLTNHIIRANVSLAFSPEEDPQKIKEIIIMCTKRLQGIIENPAPEVYFSEITENAIKFSIFFWVYLNREKNKSEYESLLREDLFKEIKNNNLKLAKPMLTVNI